MKLADRLDKLEIAYNAGDRPIGVYYEGGTVAMYGIDTGLTRQHWQAKHPTGLLIIVQYRDRSLKHE